jgi:hypothetical protein
VVSEILAYNPYFDRGFDNAYLSTKGVASGEDVLFPNDTLGDYFYIRQTGVTISSPKQLAISSCSTPYMAMQNAVLIAVMRDGDRVQLLNNLVSTLSWLKVAFGAAQLQAETVITQEIGHMGADVLNAALARLDNTAIISINFSYNLELSYYTKSPDCLPKPCKTC